MKTRNFQGQAEVFQMMTHEPLSQAMEALRRRPRLSGVSLTGSAPFLLPCPHFPPPLPIFSLSSPQLAQFPGVVAVVLGLLGTRALSIKCPARKFRSNHPWGLPGRDLFPLPLTSPGERPGPVSQPRWEEKLLESHTDLRGMETLILNLYVPSPVIVLSFFCSPLDSQ